MGMYIRPAEDVMAEGIEINVPSTYDDAKHQLRDGEHLAAVAHRPHGMVALLIAHRDDFDHVRKAGCAGMFIIADDLAKRAH